MSSKTEKSRMSTKKFTLMFTIVAVIIYVVLDCYITFINAETGSAIFFDSTLTTEFFSYMKWLAGLGGGLQATGLITDTITDIVKARSDEESLG